VIERIEIVRSNVDVFTHEPGSADACFEWVDEDDFDAIALPAARFWPTPFCFYYLRVTQADGEMAWSSPIWVSP
jgi:hypothetical protein